MSINSRRLFSGVYHHTGPALTVYTAPARAVLRCLSGTVAGAVIGQEWSINTHFADPGDPNVWGQVFTVPGDQAFSQDIRVVLEPGEELQLELSGFLAGTLSLQGSGFVFT